MTRTTTQRLPGAGYMRPDAQPPQVNGAGWMRADGVSPSPAGAGYMRPDAQPAQVNGAGWMRPRWVTVAVLEAVPELSRPTLVVSGEEPVLRNAA